MKKQHIGIVGLGVMGQNLALNMESHGFSVAGFDLSAEKREVLGDVFEGKEIRIVDSLSELIESLETPRRILFMVPAGKAVDEVIDQLKGHLSEGDILMDGGNSFFKDTERRYRMLDAEGILFIGTGVSGGEEGALKGPSIMPGGSTRAWEAVKPVLQAIAAKAEDGKPCCEWMGTGGAGHFVKMVHNGIEYADMQMICEAYFLMEQALGLTAEEMHRVFKEWNSGDLDSYLIEITADIMAKKDDETGRPMIDVILDTAGQKGTGKWTSQIALDVGVPAPTIAEAVFSRTVSALKNERVQASQLLKGPGPIQFEGDREEVIELIRRALYASKICSYAQGFQLLRFASEEFHFDLNYGEIASIWRAGCIIRARFLNRIKAAFDREPNLANLLLDSYFRSAVDESQEAWRILVGRAVRWGIPIPAFSSALAYYDSYRSARLPANLLQAQRDYFGAHTYERLDRERGEFFHTEWQA